ncbi:hypothetical protein C2845_PM09G20240 [Panicum miliaceum]|uniref:DUF2828 domain-containing protein n=1 Tax=Panicum miliaceum TaxID=4540 RepID=A0A3L6RY81_PANMI|nr:hypothetical protein C2845_PM09G20240 [Panicum miliaceum]
MPATVSASLVGPPGEFLRAAAAIRRASAPAKRLTENSSPTFVSSGDPCLDFFHVVPGTPAARVASLLADAWAAEPNTALRLACNLLGVRGTGKSDRRGFYAAALWMHECHPATLALNAPAIVEFGYLKDLPEILHRIVRGAVSAKKPGKKVEVRLAGAAQGLLLLNTEECAAAFQELGRKIERRWRAEAAERAIERYGRDPNYRFLHDCTADMFADLLAMDLRKLADGKLDEISLAGKWCPSLNCRYDRSSLLSEAIARRLFPKGSAPDLPEDMADVYYVYQVRNRLRKALASLRRALQLPEIFITAQAWGAVVYPRVASRAMRKYRELFLKDDADRFKLYLADVEAGKAKIAAGALLPHEILAGKLSNCIAICDVSGSMSGLPMDVCVALGLLISELSDEPWHHRLITFSERPEMHLITGKTLRQKTNFIRRMHWDMNTNFQAVFDKLLSVAVAGKLPPERMVRRVFVFSDMEFDEASSRPLETDYEAITRKFEEAGYGAVVPEIVFWNLRDSMSVPVTGGEKGVALVSGFSKNMVKLFLDNDGIISPRVVMEKAISGPEYQKLVVFD